MATVYSGPQADLANAIAIIIVGFLSMFLAYLPLRSFIQRRNVPAISLVVASLIASVFTILNAIIWHSDEQSIWWKGYGLCDVQIALRYPLTTALSASLCALSRGLANCLDTSNGICQPTKAQKRRKIVLDLAICWTVPILQLGLQYIVRDGRYTIGPVFGCAVDLDNSWPTIVIIMIWCPLFIVANMYYAGKIDLSLRSENSLIDLGLLLVRFYKHQKAIGRILLNSGSGFRIRPYITMVIITLSLVVIYLPVQMIFTRQVIPASLNRYSWTEVHNNKNFAPVFVHTGEAPMLQYRGWTPIATLQLLWAFYGFDDHAMEFYRWTLIKLGFAYFWPKLMYTKQQRESLRQATGAEICPCIGRLCRMFNVVNMVMKYFNFDEQDGAGLTGDSLHRYVS
jgi:pheromone a factor receptor